MTDAVDSAADVHGARPDLSGWEDPPRIAQRGVAPVLSVDGFEGPLDWLLEMARARKINLAQLSIAALIGQFAEALATALAGGNVRQIERWAGWTVMAAALTELWSRLLLPADAAASRAAETEAEALRRQLLARQRMREAADWLARRPQLGWDVFPRGRPEASLGARGSDIADLLRACLLVLQVPEAQAAAYRPRPPALWRVTDAIPLMRQLLAAVPDGGPLAGFLPAIAGDDPGRALRCRAAVASTLVAGLELARDGALALEQDAAWMPIRVSRRDDHDARLTDTAVPVRTAGLTGGASVIGSTTPRASFQGPAPERKARAIEVQRSCFVPDPASMPARWRDPR
jgi:segregation and condensation protein A